MVRLKNSRIFFAAAVLYAVLIFYLSVTSNIGNLKHLLNITLGHGTRDILIASNLSFVLQFLVDSFNFAEMESIDPGHVGVYFGFGILLYLMFVSSRNKMLAKYSAACAIFTGTAYGILNEIFQMYLSYRTATVADALSNLLGLVLAQLLIVIFVLILREVQNRKKEQRISKLRI
jgi:VanZ family protein